MNSGQYQIVNRTDTMSNLIRWGILGTGGIAHQFANAIATTPDTVLSAVASRSLAKAQTFAQQYAAPQAYGNYADLATSGDVDVIYIATPHSDHHPSTMLCLQAGKAVLCEKPFAINLAQAEAMVDLARSQGVFLMEALLTRLSPALIETRKQLDAGLIGTLHSLHADFGFAASHLPNDHRLFNPALGGGALLDLGIYPISIASYLLGPIVATSAQAHIGPTGVDIETVASLRHRDGGTSTILCTARAASTSVTTLYGSLGTAQLHAPFCPPNYLSVALSGAAATTIALQTDEAGYAGGYQREVQHVNECLRAGKLESERMPLEESLHLMRVLDEIRGGIGVRYPEDVA